MRGPLNRIFATTGSLRTQAKIARRYLYALVHHGSIRKYWNFLKVELAHLRGAETVNGFPYVLKIESTNICNLECPFCLDRDRSTFKQEGMRGFGRMKSDFFKSVIDQLAPYAFNVNLYGSGEPLLFPEAYEMFRYAADKNIGVRVSSNLSMRDFTDEMAEKVVSSGIEHLIISCHGASQETYE
jgi:MoaA/NifB/PqqE/SkfB family radical SAM enzyme